MIVWLVGGVDPTGGAGLARDEATLRAFAPAATGVALVTAMTRQGHGAPATATPSDPMRLLAIARELPLPQAIKIGLLPATLAETVAELALAQRVPCVVDPVLAASDGGRMGVRADALAPVLAAATIVTPNRPEAAELTGCPPDDPDLLARCVERWPNAWVLLKDGHRRSPRVRDELACGDERHAFERERLPSPDPRGTGCALATAIAAGLARGDAVPVAVGNAIAWLDRARRSVHRGPDGRDHLD